MSESEFTEDQNKGYTRKRSKTEDTWQKNVNKVKRNSGEEYSTIKNRKLVPKRTVGSPCSCGCFEKVGLEKISIIFKNFWELSEYNLQNAYLSKRVKSVSVNRCRIKNRPSRKLRSIEYSVLFESNEFKVCRKAFYAIHGVTEKRVRTVLNKVSTSGTVELDRRGNKNPVNKVSVEMKETVMLHVNSLPKCSSHYSRAKSPYRKYLSTDLNINKLYDLYCEWMTENHPLIDPVSSRFYRDTFNKKFNIGFNPPKSDTCNFCDKTDIMELSNCDDLQRNQLQVAKELHLRRAKAVQKILKSYKSNNEDSVSAICIDLQQTLPTPKLTTSVQYYKRKLWTYNFAVHDVKSGKCVMYMWNESTGGRGSCEIASCLSHYFDSMDHQVKKVVLFSDNCGGQNKNMNIVLACLKKIHELKFDFIEHYFMIPGHSYLPCDRDFGHIELRLRNIDVYSEDHYIDLIRSSRKVRPFKVVKMTSSMFFDFTALQKLITKRKSTASFKDGKVFLYSKLFKQGFSIQPTYQNVLSEQVVLQKGKVGEYQRHLFDLSAAVLSPKYQQPIKLSEEKIKDIKSLLPYIPLHHRSFFDELISLQESQTNLATLTGESQDDVMDFCLN
uniref:Uncharacterized protein LOC114325933 n=1 Tax=Diabrotica virgifera virgifera TaxID=50390 RepID=A0A6P7F869_DIAVI